MLKIVMIEKKYGILIGVIISLLICLIVYYNMLVGDRGIVNNSFMEGEEFYSNREYEKAIAKYQEYLVYTHNSSDKRRWLAWQRLLYITIQLKSNLSEGIDILKAMEKEYAHDIEYIPQVLKEMVQVYHMQRSKENVLQTLEKIITSNFSLSQEEKIQFYRQYAMLIEENVKLFERGEAQLELCIQKEEENVVKWCQYELGVIYTLGEKYKKARPIFDSLIAKSKETDVIHYSSRFMMATMYEFLGEKQRAIDEYRAIQDIYPNKEVIESRIKAIQKRLRNE